MFTDGLPAKALALGSKVRALGVSRLEWVQALADVVPLSEVGIPGTNTAS